MNKDNNIDTTREILNMRTYNSFSHIVLGAFVKKPLACRWVYITNSITLTWYITPIGRYLLESINDNEYNVYKSVSDYRNENACLSYDATSNVYEDSCDNGFDEVFYSYIFEEYVRTNPIFTMVTSAVRLSTLSQYEQLHTYDPSDQEILFGLSKRASHPLSKKSIRFINHYFNFYKRNEKHINSSWWDIHITRKKILCMTDKELITTYCTR